MRDLVAAKKAKIAELEKQKKEAIGMQESEMKKMGQATKEEFLIGSDQPLLESSHIPLQFRVEVSNEEELKDKYKTFNDDSLLEAVREQLDMIKRQKEKEK